MVTLYIGDSWSYVGQVTLTQPNGSTVPATGWTISSVLYNAQGNPAGNFTCGWVDVNTGTFFHKMLNTSRLTPGNYKFVITLTSPNQEVITTDPSSIQIKKVGS